jgi:DNA-directed RNA polymerase subunit E'/Rpb7
MTMRQPFLGKIEWIAEDAEAARKQLEERRKEALAKTA